MECKGLVKLTVEIQQSLDKLGFHASIIAGTKVKVASLRSQRHITMK